MQDRRARDALGSGHAFPWRPPSSCASTFAARVVCSTEADLHAAVVAHDITRRHGLTAAALLGHSDIAPGRKADPGELFPWEILAAEGLGLWPRDDARPQPPAAGRQ